MELFMQIGIVIIAIGSIILIYSIVQTMKVLRAAIEEMQLMIGQVRVDVSHISDDIKKAVHNTNEMTIDVKSKLSSLDSVFDAANDIGQTVQAFTGIAKQSATQLAVTIEEQQHPVKQSEKQLTSAIVDGVMSTLRIWKKVKGI
ncbi:DUF948 domain-containing protein [Paenibacillus yanchengensis]|uniref:DUF948 domain-containing protein n=1 Tax=Paenibacillus yanchengensis TaxID=2035833 RepID=A0ABW4YJ21_9BACL